MGCMCGCRDRMAGVTVFVQDADFTLHHGDCLDVLRSLPNGCANACVTSPPYLDARPEYPSPSLHNFEDIFSEIGRVIDTGPLLLNVGRLWRNGSESLWWHALLKAADRAGFDLLDTLIWHKPNANPIRGKFFIDSHEYVFVLGGPATIVNVDDLRRPYAASSKARVDRGWTNHIGVKNVHSERQRSSAELHDLGGRPSSVVTFGVGVAKGNPHPAPMATALAEHMVKAACESGGTVLDPFMGSGTTALVARNLGRRSIGVELNADYCALAARRLGQQSLLAGDAA